MITEKAFDTGELRLNYAEGPAVGRPLILLHGMTGRWENWTPLLPRLTESWHVYAFDLRGHGKSGRKANQYHLSNYVQDIVAFLQREMDEPAVVLGHSLGALTALGVAADVPDRVRAAVLIDPPLYIRNNSVALQPETAHWFKQVYKITSTAKNEDELLEMCREIAPDENWLRLFAETLAGVAPDTVRIAYEDRLLDGFDLARTFRRVTVPMLILQADWEHGGAMRDEDADFVQAQLSHVEIMKPPKAGHQIPSEHGEAVLEQLQRFVQPQ